MKLRHSIDCLGHNPALLAAVVTAVSCAILLLLSESLNKDAIIYLHAADEFKTGGWAAAESAYPRPFFSVLIGSLSQLLSLSSAASAQLVIMVLAALSSFAFVKFIKDLGYSHKTQLIAAAIIFAYPGISAYRDYVIRDFGYWAFVFLTLSAAVKHQRSGNLIHAVECVLLGVVATLFRPEAITFLLAIPIASLFVYHGNTAKPTKVAGNFAILVVVGILAGYLLASAFNIQLVQAAHNLAFEAPINILQDITDSWRSASNTIEQHLLNQHSREYAGASVAAVYTTIFSAQLLNGLTWFIAALALYVHMTKSWQSVKHPIYLAALIACTIPLVVFLVHMQFLQTRYIMLLCLLVAIPVCASLANSLETHGRTRFKTGFLIAVFSLAILDNHLSTGRSKSYIGESISWLNRTNEQQHSIASNNLELSYKTNPSFEFHPAKKLSVDKDFPLNLKASQFEIIAWQHDDISKCPERLTLGKRQFTAVQKFRNQKDEGIVIYRANPS